MMPPAGGEAWLTLLRASDGLPAFPATVEAITALGAVADSPGPGLTSSTEVTPGIDMLHALLGQQHGAEGDQGTQAAPVVSLGHPFRCTVQVNTTAEQRGMSLARVPLPHPQQLLPALQILRRQAVYNELFCSCLPQASASLSPGAQGERAVRLPSMERRELCAPDDRLFLFDARSCPLHIRTHRRRRRRPRVAIHRPRCRLDD